MRGLKKAIWCGRVLIGGLALGLAPPSARAGDGDFRVLEPGTPLRGAVWVGDGPASLWSSQHSQYIANRIELGLELAWGRDYQWFVSWIPLDELDSAESAQPMGSLSRSGMDFAAGYWFVPDRWWIKYTYLIESVKGDQVYHFENTHGHGLAVGYRLFDQNNFNLAVEAGYQYIQPLPFTLIDNYTNAASAAAYPSANVFSVTFRIGVDIGGRGGP